MHEVACFGARAGRSGARRQADGDAGSIGVGLTSRSSRQRAGAAGGAWPGTGVAQARQIAQPDARDQGVTHPIRPIYLLSCLVRPGADRSEDDPQI